MSLRKKCPYSKLFWSAFSRIRSENGEIFRMRENVNQNNFEYGQFSHSVSIAEAHLGLCQTTVMDHFLQK